MINVNKIADEMWKHRSWTAESVDRGLVFACQCAEVLPADAGTVIALHERHRAQVILNTFVEPRMTVTDGMVERAAREMWVLNTQGEVSRAEKLAMWDDRVDGHHLKASSRENARAILSAALEVLGEAMA